MSENVRTARIFYLIFVIFIGAGALLFLILSLIGISPEKFFGELLPSCIFREYAGIYCPGCGGTRSFFYLMHGDILQSLYYHPFVLYAAVLISIFVIHYTLSLVSKNKIKKPVFRLVYVYIGVAVIFIQWIIKLIFLLCFNIQLIPF